MYLDEIPSPCFVLKQKLLNRNLEVFRRIEKESGVWALVALKGFAFYHVFDQVAEVIHGATASSLNEVLLAKKYFKEVHVCAPVYINNEFDQIAATALLTLLFHPMTF